MAVARQTLVDRLTPVADRIRGILHPRFGTRPYSVVIVILRWSGGKRGQGEPTVGREIPLAPTPKVTGIGGLDASLHPIGRDEEGDIELSEMSLSLAESMVSPYTGPSPLPADEEWFYEVRWNSGKRRRFAPIGVPERDVNQMGWRLRCRAQDPERRVSGLPYR
jgi:hypothetical protein